MNSRRLACSNEVKKIKVELGHSGASNETIFFISCVNKINRTPMIGGNATLLITPHFEHHIKKFLYLTQNPTILFNSFILRNYASYSSQP